MHTFMSFDVDRILVDRNRSCHQLTPQVREALLQVTETPGVAVILNTGRDLGALREFDMKFGKTLDAFFSLGAERE